MYYVTIKGLVNNMTGRERGEGDGGLRYITQHYLISVK